VLPLEGTPASASPCPREGLQALFWAFFGKGGARTEQEGPVATSICSKKASGELAVELGSRSLP